MPRFLVALLLALLGSTAACRPQAPEWREQALRADHAAAEPVAADTSFARLVEQLSEPGGFFDTDNLISNERSYLHVLGKMREMGVTGGAYIGVGPDQNFSYIAQIRPEIAFIVDIRRDNLLQHLMYKAMFAEARNRLEYLCLWLGRPAPQKLAQWDDYSIQELVDYVDATPPDSAWVAQARLAARERVQRFGVPLSPADLSTIERFHSAFIADGLDLRFTSLGRGPQPGYPTLRDLLLETDLTGRPASYLAHEGDFRFLKELQARDRIIPVVGDLAGDHALAEVGRVIAERGETVSAFYTSNVEFYLMSNGSFARFAETVTRLPHNERSVMIRSHFNRPRHPQAVPGYNSTQLLQTIRSFADEQKRGGLTSYWDLVTRHSLELR